MIIVVKAGDKVVYHNNATQQTVNAVVTEVTRRKHIKIQCDGADSVHPAYFDVEGYERCLNTNMFLDGAITLPSANLNSLDSQTNRTENKMSNARTTQYAAQQTKLIDQTAHTLRTVRGVYAVTLPTLYDAVQELHGTFSLSEDVFRDLVYKHDTLSVREVRVQPHGGFNATTAVVCLADLCAD